MNGFPTPYFALLGFGLFIGLTSGIAFQETLRQKVQVWAKTRENQQKLPTILTGVELRLPFLGIMIGVCIFLASGVGIFGFGVKSAFIFSAVMTVLTGIAVWYQLSKILNLIQEGGSEALDLESVF